MHYRGVVIEEFDGTIKQVDLRYETPRLKLILWAGGKEIDCTFAGATSDQIRDILDQRVRVEGCAHYNGRSGLPEHIEIQRYQAVKTNPDILRWGGAFTNLGPLVWDHYDDPDDPDDPPEQQGADGQDE